VFNNMLIECQDDEKYTAKQQLSLEANVTLQSHCVWLIFRQQQKMISQLIDRLSKTNVDARCCILFILVLSANDVDKHQYSQSHTYKKLSS
jgi:hypothetical protein